VYARCVRAVACLRLCLIDSWPLIMRGSIDALVLATCRQRRDSKDSVYLLGTCQSRRSWFLRVSVVRSS
jgi:hypothetical protein